MNVLIVYSHPNDKSFNHALKEKVHAQLEALDCLVKLRDLYVDDFDPVLSAQDLVAIRNGTMPADIKKEQDEVSWADVLIMIHPVWWTGFPAMVKGYIDRVFAFGFAYTYEDGAPKGLLNGKKALIINTTGAPYDYYAQAGMHEALKKTSDEGIYAFCGMEVMDHIFLGAVPAVTDDVRKQYLDDIEKKIKDHFGRKC